MVIYFISIRPKSPPNSPNCELATFAEELSGVYVNRIKTDPVGVHGYSTSAANGPSSTPPFSNSSSNGVTASDIVWDWTSRPNIPKYDHLQLFKIIDYQISIFHYIPIFNVFS